jgi:hypothetical protein
MDNDNSPAHGRTNNGREIEFFLYRTWSVAPKPSENAPDCEAVDTIDGTTYQANTVKGVAGMIDVLVSPPPGQNPWGCSKHCHHLDITYMEFKKIGDTVRLFLSYSDGDQDDFLVEPMMGCH